MESNHSVGFFKTNMSESWSKCQKVAVPPFLTVCSFHPRFTLPYTPHRKSTHSSLMTEPPRMLTLPPLVMFHWSSL